MFCLGWIDDYTGPVPNTSYFETLKASTGIHELSNGGRVSRRVIEVDYLYVWARLRNGGNGIYPNVCATAVMYNVRLLL